MIERMNQLYSAVLVFTLATENFPTFSNCLLSCNIWIYFVGDFCLDFETNIWIEDLLFYSWENIEKHCCGIFIVVKILPYHFFILICNISDNN